MARALFQGVCRASRLFQSCYPRPLLRRSIICTQHSMLSASKQLLPPRPMNLLWASRNMSYGSVDLVISEGKPKFEAHEVDPPKKERWKTKKRLKLQRKREKQKRKAANRKDPRQLNTKGKKQKFSSAEERIKYKLEKAKIKETKLVERLKRYEVPKSQGPMVKPDGLTGEERFYLVKMTQKRSNYVPVGKRGIFGGLILNMHMHWKKHETVKVICKPCKPGQVHEYAKEIARLSGGIPIQIIGNNTIIFYRGKNYVQPEVMSPVDTLSKKRALEKSKYEQSLECVRRFIAIAEKELELYYRHIALYGDPNDRNPISILDRPANDKETLEMLESRNQNLTNDGFPSQLAEMETDSTDQELSENEDGWEDASLSSGKSSFKYYTSEPDECFSKGGTEEIPFCMEGGYAKNLGSSLVSKYDSN